ncbi:hypothetical protein, conserved [Trypanosoma cruzi]|uniref:Uncharacterized protein n=1 Tax=Trypanosoma cruzi (strain CL Brener) TaxID=353153 RepID=Q4D964_TRYCC|nr:hypothetical protein, conserved [Trypanosoma cruzi]EAN89063.1 hypothetical protein, conserved [Trypanosoma cruzi]|eukprot:XP_810914.1 hypothetical protein [Trypanosoma cruzi strain CL Brener]
MVFGLLSERFLVECMNTQLGDVEVVPQLSKRATRYSAEMVKLLLIMDRTHSSNWASLSTMLTQLLKCIESNIEAATEVLPDPVLLCRVIWKCFDPKGVMGVHRKALDVLQRLCLCVGTSALIRQMPLLLVGVLELLPQCSIQVKCELLHFVEVHMLRTLPPGVVAVELPGILSAILGGLEEKDTTEVYRSTLKIMEALHTILRNAETMISANSNPIEEVDDNHHEKEIPLGNSSEGGGEVILYSALWLTLKNCPSLRACVLLYLKMRLCVGVSQAHSVGHGSVLAESEGLEKEKKNICLLAAPTPFSIILGSDPRIVHSAIFATLQEQSERKHRLMLDILISAFPLDVETTFTFEERSWLVAAVIQLLGFSDVNISIRRRIAGWLTGSNPGRASMYVQEVSSFLVAHAFYGVVRWWESRFVPSTATDNRGNTSKMNTLEESYYQVLFASACKRCLPLADSSASSKMSINLTEAYLTPNVWLRAFMSFFQQFFVLNDADDADDGDDKNSNNTNNDNDSDDYARYSGAGDGFSPRTIGNPFIEHVVPLVMPFVCDLLVSMELWKRENPRQSSAIDSTLTAVFSVVTWDYFTCYEHDLISILEGCLDGLREIAAFYLPATGVGEILEGSQEGCNVNETPNKPIPFCESHGKLISDFQVCFRRLIGLVSAVEPHVMGLMDLDVERTTAFLQGIFKTSQSLCSIVWGACEILLAHDNTGSESAHFSIAQCLINGCLDSFNFIFFGMFSALQDRVELAGSCNTIREKEGALLDSMMRSSTAMAEIVLRGCSACAETLARINDTVFSLFQRSLQLGGKSPLSSSDNSFGVCEDILVSWVESVFSLTDSTCLTVQKDALQLYADLLSSTTLPLALQSAKFIEELTVKFLPRLWELLGTCNAGMQPHVVQLLVRLYATHEGRAILDNITSVATTENGERLLLLFCLLDEENVSENVFLPGLFMMLRALDCKDAPLRRLAHSMVRQSLPCFHRVLNPLFDSLVRYLTSRGAADEEKTAAAEHVDCVSAHFNNQIFLEHEMNGLSPMEFLCLVKSILAIPSFLLPLLTRLHQLQPPEGFRALMTTIFPRPLAAAGDQKGESDMPLNSAFAVLGCLLLGIVRRCLLPQSDGLGEDNPRLYVELCIEACETLNLMLEGTLSLSNPPETVVHTWYYATFQTMDFLHEVVKRPELSVTQLLMLKHFVDAVRFLNAVTPTPTSFPLDAYFCMLANKAHKIEASETVVDGADRSTARNCIVALKIPKFYTTVALGLEQATATALTSAWAAYDLLSVWCNTLLELLPFFHEELDGASAHLLKIFLRVIDQLLVQTTSVTECANSRVIEKFLNAVYGLLEYQLATEKQRRQSYASGRGQSVGWFAAHVPIFGSGGGSSSSAQKATGVDAAASIGAVRHSIRPVVSILCKLHCAMHKAQAQRVVEGERPRYGVRGRVVCSNLESAIHRVLRLYAQEMGAEFYKVFIDVWAAGHAQPFTEMFTSLAPRGIHLFNDAVRNRMELLPLIGSGNEMALSFPMFLGDQELIVQLLNAGTGITVLSLIRVLEELLKQNCSNNTTNCSSSSRRHMLGAELPFDASVFYYLYTFIYTCRVPSGETQEVLNALIDVAITHLSQGSPSVVCLGLIVQVFSHFVLGQSVPRSSPSSPCETVEGSCVEWGKDKRCSNIICKVLDALGSVALHTSSMQGELMFSFKMLSVALPRLACGALSDQDRIATAVLSFYKRSLLPTIMFGADSQTDADVFARTPLVKAALSVLQAIIRLGDTVTRRLRQELLDVLCTCDFFNFPQSVIHEWGVIFEWLSQDWTFHGEAVQFLAPSSSHSSRIVALIHSADEEERQRVRQIKRLAFYVTCMLPSTLMLDREFCLLIRGRIADSLRSFHSIASGNSSNGSGSGYRSVRYALFLFRVLVTKLDPVLLHPFWPVVLPTAFRALSIPSPSVDAAAGKRKNTDGELLALQMECLKLLDFVGVIMPDTFSPFHWVFFDDLDATNVIVPNNAKEVFIPIVHRLELSLRLRTVSLQDVWAPAVSSSSAFTNWTGYQRPLLRFPPICYGSLRGIGPCAAALSLFYRSGGFLTASQAPEQLLSAASTRLMDGWDEAYVRALVEADLSCVLDNTLPTPSR